MESPILEKKKDDNLTLHSYVCYRSQCLNDRGQQNFIYTLKIPANTFEFAVRYMQPKVYYIKYNEHMQVKLG